MQRPGGEFSIESGSDPLFAARAVTTTAFRIAYQIRQGVAQH